MRILLRDLSPGTQYAIQLRSQDANGNTSAWSRIFYLTTTADTIAPNTPTGLAVVSNGSTFVATWNAVTQSSDGTPAHDLAGYLVQVDSPLGAGTRTYKTVDTRLEFPFESNVSVFGTPRATVRFSVAAIDSTGNTSAYSAQVQASNPAPANPTGFTADPVVDGIALKWNAVADTDLTGYRIYQGTTAGSQTTLVWSGNATSKTVANFAYSADAYYKVAAVDVFGTESTAPPVVGPVRPKSSFTVDTTPPSVPTGLAATLTNATDGKTAKADVTWTAVTDTDGDLSEYIVGYKPSSDTNWQYAKVDYTNTATTINGLLPYTNYDFRIRSSDWAANLSAWSSVVTKTATANAAPATVTGVSVTGGKDSLTIKWTPNTEPDVANGAGVYLVDIATNTGFTTGLLSYRTGEAGITVTGLAQGTTYYVRVKAVDSLGLASAAWSTTANATTGTLATQFTYTTAATAPSSPNVGDIWMDTTSGFEKQWSGSAWVQTGNASINYISAKGTDLVTNGTGYMKNNYNFAQYFDASLTDVPTGSTTSFYDKSTGYGYRGIDELIPFDPSKKYKFSFKMRQTVSGATNRAYGLLAPYDAWGNSIQPSTYMFQANTTTTLAQPLNNGDTVVYLTSVANWTGSASKPGGTNTHLRSFIFWNWVDPNGKTWGPHTYSRNTWKTDAWADGAVDPATNTITLRAAWNGGNYPAGNPVSNGSSAGSYLYMPSLQNQVVVPETWTTYSDIFSAGLMPDKTAADGNTGATWTTGMPPGTANIKVGWLLNAAPSPANPIVGRHAVAAISFSDASAAQQTADGAVKTYVNEYAVNSSETVAPSSGWSTSTPARTPGTFVWFRTTVTRADGTTSTTSPALLTGNTGAQGSQGIPGTPGADGVSLYTWVKYADTPTTGMSDSPTGKTYMGIAYNKTSSTESSVYSDYEWSLIKGSDGIQGPPGADGTTTYTWVKYADTVTGTGMSDDPTGKTYIGLAFNKTTATESTTATDYQWSLIQGPQGPAGAPGANAEVINLTASTQVLTSPAGGGATSPATATVTGTATNTTIGYYEYSVDGAAFSTTVPTGVSRTGNVVTITGGTMTAKTIAVRMSKSSGSPVADTLTVAKVFDGATGATGGTGPAGSAGADAVTILLTNEAATFAAGTTNALAGSATTNVNAWKGTTAQSVSVGTITGGATGITAAVTNNNTTSPTITFTVTTALTTANGTFTIPVTAGGITVNQIFSWSLAFTGAQGTAGANAKSIDLTTTTQVLASPSGGGATTPATATVTGTPTNTTITVWEYAVDGGAFSATVPAGVSRTGNVVTITGSTMTARTITVRMADAGGVADTLTVAKTFDGATGATGGTGGTGPAGADAYTVILTNEAQVFPGTTNAAVAGSATTSVIAYKGATQMPATIGTVTGQVTGLTTAITNNGTNNATVTVTVTTALTTQSGVLTIPVTVDGKSFTKSFAWSVSYTGAQGATGGTGPTGVGITSITPYFAQVTTGSAAPAKPTTATPSAPWTATEPDYVANTELYRTEKVLYTDATFSYTNVQKVSSYAAAATAIASANGKNKIIYSTGTPGTTANTAGDIWFQQDGSQKVIGQWIGAGGTSWTQTTIRSEVIANLDVNKLTAGTGFVTTLNIASGGAIQSAGYTSGGSSGFQLSTSGLVIKGTGNSVAVEAVQAGTISAKTINIGAGGVLNVDATGTIKSNNYSAGLTGYALGATGLEVNDGSIDAKALRTNTAIIGDLTIGRSADTAGTIKSFDYVAGSAGWKIGKGLFEINDGLIKAGAVQIQTSNNMVPAAYADFEYGDYYYLNAFWNARGQGNLSISGGLAAANTAADSLTVPFKGKQYLGISSVGSTNALLSTFAPTGTTYNIPVEPGQSYIFSGYFRNRLTTAQPDWLFGVKGEDGNIITTVPVNLVAGPLSGAFTRYEGTVTIPAGINNVSLVLNNSNTTYAKDIHVDCLQFEPKGNLTAASPWKPPATTTIDASGITTGMMRSSNDIVVGGSTQPAWSLNKSGNIQVGDALVRGKLIVGTGNEIAPNRAPNNGDFETDVTGYSVYQSGATGTAIARTTTAGEVVMGTGAAKITAAAGTKTSLGIQFATPSAYPTGTTITISGYVRANAAGGSLYADALNASAVVVDTEVITAIPTANDAYYFSATFTLDVTSNVTTIALYQNNGATGITTTSIIFDTLVLTSSIDMGESFVASANFITGDAGQGWKIDGNGNVEFNSGYFRGQLGSGIVTADAIASDIVMSSTFRTGYSGQRVEFDSTGIVMYDTINQPIIQLPTDPSAKATFQGDLVASSMTVEDQLAIRGNGNEISKGSTVTLQSGTTAPSSPPTVTVDWKTISATADAAFAPYRYGITVQGGWFRVAQVIYGGGTVVDSYDLTTGAHQWGNLNTAANDGMWNALGGITSIGNNVYMLGTNKAGQWRLMGWTFGTGVTGTPTRLFNVSYPQSADHRIPALGNDGTNLIVALTNQTNLVQVRSFSATTGAQLTAALVSDLTMASDVAFVNKGAFDNGFGLTAGTPVYVVGLKNSATAYVLDQNFKRLNSGGHDFPLITKPAGQCFYNGKFYTFDAAGNRITEHTGASWNSNTAGMDKWWAANSWYNSTGPYETMIGPIAGFTMKKRARAVITSPPIPKALGVPEDVKAVGLYMARGNTTPTRTLFQRQTYLADGVRTIKMQEELNSTMPAPGATNTDTASQPKASSNFPNTTPGALKDAAGRFNLYGDGSGNWAGINVNSAGTLTITGMSSQIWSSNIEVGSATSTAQPSWTLRRLNSDSLSDTQVIGYIQSNTGSYFAMNLYKSGTMKNQVVVREDGRMTVNGKYVPIIDTGTAAIGAVAAGGAVTINVTFASGRFTATPVVSAISDSARHSIACTARSATGATFVINNWSGGNAAAGTLQWFALQE